MDKAALIKKIKAECKSAGVKVSIRNVSYVTMSGNIKCAGYFDSYDRELVVALNHSHGLETLIHEYCHFLQWNEQCNVWVDNCDSIEMVDLWLSGEPIEDIDRHISNVRDLELDNEIRSLWFIKTNGLESEIDPDRYTQKANAYINFYNWLKISRRWPQPKNAPYTNERIVNAMSTKFDMDYTKLDPNIEELFRQEKI
jgi:hypothetical protein